MNQKQTRNWWKVASLVAGKYQASTNYQNLNWDANRIRNSATIMGRLLRRIEIASSRNWQASQKLSISTYRRKTQQMGKLLDEIQTRISEAGQQPDVKTREVFLDLTALRQEFEDLRFDAKAKILSGVSKRIQLEDLNLGCFRIELHLDTLAGRGYYEVVAVDTNRASSNDRVTHPHVQDDRLCEGDAQPAIKLALQQGRLLDFFQIVEQVLSTYNPDSAYVMIDQWKGTTCRHCGHSADPDETRECGGCDAIICDSCVYRCCDCDDSFCGNCDATCGGCLDSVCKSCVKTCQACDESFCSDCLTENERCTPCEEKSKESSATGSSEAEVHGQLVGQVAVSP